MLTFPNCKINIGLFITNRRSDGYHDLETIFYPIPQLKDALEIVPAKDGATAIVMSGLSVSGDKTGNLVWKAYELMKTRYHEAIPELDIFLHKAIPMGAGLGGGSADGAFMLRLLNEFCLLHLNKEELAEIALALGSDCPFFIYNTPRFATGRGETMQPVQLDLSAFEVRVITSDIHVATKDAFAKIQPKPSAFNLQLLSIDDIENWKHYVQNDFEASVFSVYPKLSETKQRLYDEGALYASMSGSGSAIYGIFKKQS